MKALLWTLGILIAIGAFFLAIWYFFFRPKPIPTNVIYRDPSSPVAPTPYITNAIAYAVPPNRRTPSSRGGGGLAGSANSIGSAFGNSVLPGAGRITGAIAGTVAGSATAVASGSFDAGDILNVAFPINPIDVTSDVFNSIGSIF